ncbi:ASST-domain-containing protein [Ilyonectria sp. MPI-CAGE-AT-0026]|nr:ASST-domain-containing protein [Ilyonectria sp. MPI-CAGE-AT-0026]
MSQGQYSSTLLGSFNAGWFRPRRCGSRVSWFFFGVCLCLVLGVTGTIHIGLLLKWLLVRLHWRNDLTWYDLGWYGLAPTAQYQSFDHPIPAIEFLQQDARCSQDYIFLAPRGPLVAEPGAVILDAVGDLVWRQIDQGGDTHDLRVQEYFGEKYLTFWVGEEIGGRKQGSWFMMDNTYTIRHEILPGGDYDTGDMHEFQITTDNTALITIYEPIVADLSSIGGPSEGYLLDSIFQEISISTGEILFEWSASSHVPLDNTFWTTKLCRDDSNTAFNGCGHNEDSAFDFYHLNSVEKDEQGNYLICGRNVHTVSYINGVTGEIIWNLGGPNNEFEDLSDGDATNFSWQHHARYLSLFDNGGSMIEAASESRGILLDLDIDRRTATLRVSYYHPQQMRSLSQGDVQILEDTGNVFIGWGRSAAMTEFSSDGEVLCDARFGASVFFSFGPVTSYRVFRHSWVGKPTTQPDVVVVGDTIYVSWNGATEVTIWQLEAADEDEDGQEVEFDIMSQTFREGFETEIRIPTQEKYSAIRLVALDVEGNVLGISDVIDCDFGVEWITPMMIVIITSIAMVVGFLATLFTAAVFFRRRKRNQVALSEYELLTGGDILDGEEGQLFQSHIIPGS